MDTGPATLRGIGLGIAGWLIMMIVLMPMTGSKLFGLSTPSETVTLLRDVLSTGTRHLLPR